MEADRIFRAFADETRLRILHLLAGGELCVCDLVAVLRAPQPKVSRHLAYLKRAGLVADRRSGAWRNYSLAAPKTRVEKTLLDCVTDCFEDIPSLAADARRLAAYRSTAARRC